MRLSSCGKLTLLIVFPEKLSRGSSVEFRNPVTRKVERLKV